MNDVVPVIPRCPMCFVCPLNPDGSCDHCGPKAALEWLKDLNDVERAVITEWVYRLHVQRHDCAFKGQTMCVHHDCIPF